MFRSAAMLLVVLNLPVLASAKSYHPIDSIYGGEPRATIGIAIPFGNGGNKSEREPRVELAFDHQPREDKGIGLRNTFDPAAKRPVRLGLTLSNRPKMMLNGREVAEFSNRQNLSTGAWIGIGVAVLAGGALLFYHELDEASE